MYPSYAAWTTRVCAATWVSGPAHTGLTWLGGHVCYRADAVDSPDGRPQGAAGERRAAPLCASGRAAHSPRACAGGSIKRKLKLHISHLLQMDRPDKDPAQFRFHACLSSPYIRCHTTVQSYRFAMDFPILQVLLSEVSKPLRWHAHRYTMASSPSLAGTWRGQSQPLCWC